MERLWKWIKRYSFIEGMIIGVLLCHYFYREFSIDQIKGRYELKEQEWKSSLQSKDIEIQTLSDDLAKREEYEKKYIAEATRTSTLERRLKDAQVDKETMSRRYSDLVAMRWEEKYSAERVAHQAAKERLVVLKLDMTVW